MKVGDYVRTKYGKIGKIINISKNRVSTTTYLIEWSSCKAYYVSQVKDYKSSPNIIDLIEVGDYVNGYKVLFAGAITWDNDGNVIDKRVKINYDGYDRWLSEDFIKSIVTKEQFESMEYKVGE